ncbi:hypothetical protein GRI62_13390 [Erythrobacter arachoides]|uniref:Lipoprotein n=1 Tax=Aurantiacibacter arachoides TaxID=1850444 RepID=A0A845A5A2_9SPHN|nr:hypothetical protein [Aurantiacibacter arachoides]MXO94592.1 hypothetical protein [Aurantiacibacter arachoides]
MPFRFFFALPVAFAVMLSGCTPSIPLRSVEAVANSVVGGREQSPPLTPEALRVLQTREHDVPRDVAFAATMTTLLDLGYRIQEADIATGLIVAGASSVDRLRLDFSGLGTARQTPVASAYIEPLDRGRSRVRINLAMQTAAGAGTGAAERAVWQTEPYAAFFQQLEGEVRDRRAALPAPLATPEPLATPAPVPAPAPPLPTKPAAAPATPTPTPTPSPAPSTAPLPDTDESNPG